jgi:hypothetical protein
VTRHPLAARAVWLTACGAVAPVLFAGVSLVLGAIEPGYSQWRHFVSQLTLGPHGWIQVANFLVTGALLVVFARGLYDLGMPAARSRWYPRLMAVVGASLIVDGVFVADPGLGYPPGAPSSESLTPHGIVHTVGALTAVTCISGLSIMTGRSRLSPRQDWWSRYSMATGVLAPLLWLASIVCGSLDTLGVASNAPSGLFNRLTILTCVAWIEVLSLRLLAKML